MRKRMATFLLIMILLISLFSVSAFAIGPLPQPNEALYGNGYFTENTFPNDSYMFPNDSYTFSGMASPPYIASCTGHVSAAAGGVPAALRVEAYSGDGAPLGYQWYTYTDFGGRSPIPGATGSSYTPECIYGTRSYCVGVYSIVNGMRSDEVVSSPMYVTYTGVDIISVPSRSGYAVGERVDLSGLVVRVYDSSGNYRVSYNGEGLSVYPSVLQGNGRVGVEISDGFSSDVFYVNVGADAVRQDGNHTHEFGEWEITKEATCVTTGVRTRKCSCGETESEDIAKTEHSWDEGTITKEATANNNGSRLYTCTVCQANRSEIIPAGTQTPQPTTSLDAAAAANPNGANLSVPTPAVPNNAPGSTYNNNTGNSYSNFNNSSATPGVVSGETLGGTQNAQTATSAASTSTFSADDGSGWWLIPVSAVVLVGTGIGAYYLMQKRNRD